MTVDKKPLEAFIVAWNTMPASSVDEKLSLKPGTARRIAVALRELGYDIKHKKSGNPNLKIGGSAAY